MNYSIILTLLTLKTINMQHHAFILKYLVSGLLYVCTSCLGTNKSLLNSFKIGKLGNFYFYIIIKVFYFNTYLIISYITTTKDTTSSLY